MVGGAGQGGVSNVTLMNQCQWSAKKIIKKQASALLNTAKGKKLVLLYAKRLEGKEEWGKNGKEGNAWGGKIHHIMDAKLPFT